MIETVLPFLLPLSFFGVLALWLAFYFLIRAARLCWHSFKLGYRRETLRRLEARRAAPVKPGDVGAPGPSGTLILENGRIVLKADEPNPLAPYSNSAWDELDPKYHRPRVKYAGAREDDFFDQNKIIKVED